MKSITIHGLEEPLWSLIKSKAELEGLSLNKTIKKLLEKSLGISRPEENNRKNEFKQFLGCWSKTDLDEFNTAISDIEQINPKDWK
jgi:predicted DNA-binding ribbon-helix-helix protein